MIKEIKDKPLSNEGRKTIDSYQKLKDLQRMEKINDCLLVRYMKKRGIKRPQKELDEEITNYMKNKKLRKIDLNRINIKINNLLKSQKTRPINKVIKSSSDIFETNKENATKKLTESNHISTLTPKRAILKPININKTLSNNNIEINLSQNIIKSQGNMEENEKNSNCINLEQIPNPHIDKKNSIKKKIYLKPEDELADLEKELGLEQETEMRKKRFERFYKYFSEGNEWEAIYKYNNEIYEKELEEEKKKKFEDRILLKEELDKQIKDKAVKEYNEHLENEKYKKMFNEQQNKLALLEKEKEEEKIKKLNLEKIAQREQMKAKKIMKRLELLREKKYDKDLINNVKLELEKEKKINEEKKLQNFLEMKKIIKDSENRINQKKEEKLKQREQEKQFSQDLEKNEIKKQNGKNKILNKIKSVGDYQQNEQTKKILEKMQKDLKEEDEKIKMYILNKKKMEDLKEEENKKRKIQMRKELKSYLDMQIKEKMKEKEFEKMLWREQGKIWNLDSEKYKTEQKLLEDKIRMDGLKHGEILRKQIEDNNKRKMKKNSMSSAEYSLNKNEINKIIENMEKEKGKEKIKEN